MCAARVSSWAEWPVCKAVGNTARMPTIPTVITVLLGVFEGFINATTEVITGGKDSNGNPLAAEYTSDQ
jgi:hypothetical protein